MEDVLEVKEEDIVFMEVNYASMEDLRYSSRKWDPFHRMQTNFDPPWNLDLVP